MGSRGKLVEAVEERIHEHEIPGLGDHWIKIIAAVAVDEILDKLNITLAPYAGEAK